MFVLSIIKYMQINTAVKIFLSPNRWQNLKSLILSFIDKNVRKMGT